MFLRSPEIIILDEATSALDNMSETLVKEAIDNIGDDKTVITIVHRLSTIKDCDCIYVVGKSGIVESGSHEDLMQKKECIIECTNKNKGYMCTPYFFFLKWNEMIYYYNE